MIFLGQNPLYGPKSMQMPHCLGYWAVYWSLTEKLVYYHSAVSSLFSQERGLGKEKRGWILEDELQTFVSCN